MQFDQDIDHLTKSGQDFSAKVQMIHGSALSKVWLKVLVKALVKVLVKVLVKALVKQMWIPNETRNPARFRFRHENGFQSIKNG